MIRRAWRAVAPGFLRSWVTEMRRHYGPRARLLPTRRGAVRDRVHRALGEGRFSWVFILGLNNSGTTLLERILRRHRDVRFLPHEGQFLTRALPNPVTYEVGQSWTRRLDVFRMTEDSGGWDHHRVKWDWLEKYEDRPGFLLEKSPPNTVRSRWLQKHFPPARFLAITRSPFASVEGILRRKGRDRISAEEAALHYSRGVGTMLDDLGHLEHVLFLRYEDLCEDVDGTVRRMGDLLGAPEGFPDLEGAVFEVHNASGEPMPITNMNAGSVERLRPDELDTIARVTADVRARLGYPDPRDANAPSTGASEKPEALP
jgi:hypothetical protein